MKYQSEISQQGSNLFFIDATQISTKENKYVRRKIANEATFIIKA